MYEQRSYRHSERFDHPVDGCRSCTCTDGAVHCQRKPCAFAACSHPVMKACCQTCDGKSAPWAGKLAQPRLRHRVASGDTSPPAGCLYEGRERANGETWEDASDPCSTCTCRDGFVRCERKRCPPANCRHPVQKQCCMSCDGELLEKPTFWIESKKVYL